eukprot:TRINITY_DN16710_c0_g5_i2.p1 TRINITY_DN16710_c0_g5~~TRINITY_DN16710_c0_g5_i2.p1  ORF type:complete len:380 (-),score=109.94 TRINITY_DN16710_c0_g5_i2:64-1203(-)
MADPSVEERLARLARSRDTLKGLLASYPSGWDNNCEAAFHEFRLRVVHLRREQAALDTVADKDVAWQFICRFSRTRPFLHDRCTEVLKILMLCPKWMQAFVDDPECHISDLPDDIRDNFQQKAAELTGEDPPPGQKASPRPPPARAASPPPPDVVMPRPAGMAVVVQRCSRARVLLDERTGAWGEIGNGLLVSISFAKGADAERARAAARFLLTAKLSLRPAAQKSSGNPFLSGSAAGAGASAGGGYGGGGSRSSSAAAGAARTPESVAAICKAGFEQGIVVMPQASLLSHLDERSHELTSEGVCEAKGAQELYKGFVEALQHCALDVCGGGKQSGSSNPFAAAAEGGARVPRIVASPFGGAQQLELSSTDPFMHSFNF